MTYSAGFEITVRLIPRKPEQMGRAGRWQPHAELANLRDDGSAVRQFSQRWGEFLLEPEKAKTLGFRDLNEQEGVFGFVSHKLELRDILRRAWRGDKARGGLLDPEALDELGAKARVELLDAEASLRFIQESVTQHMRPSLGFRKGEQIEIIADDFWSIVCILFLRDRAAGRTAICANAECSAPFFIRKRITQKYCERGPCTEQAQRGYMRDYWHRKGKKDRAKKRSGRTRRRQP